MIRVLLADDQELVRTGFRMLLDAQADLEVVAEARDGEEAVAACLAHGPDVVLMDVRMPRMDGIEATRRIAASPSEARVLVLTTFDLDEYVHEALVAGASGFLLKDTAPAELLRAVRVVHEGDALLSPAVTRRLVAAYVRGPAGRPAAPSGSRPLPHDLTPREVEVLALVAEGLSNTEICERLVVSMATVKTHVGRLLAKAGARDRAQLVILAYESGLVVAGA